MNAIAAPPRFLQVPATLLASVRTAVVGDRQPLEAVTVLRQLGYELGEEVYASLQDRVSRDFSGVDWGGWSSATFTRRWDPSS
jgi:hypothetical protein